MGVCRKLEKDVPIRCSASKFHEMFHKKPHHISKACCDKIHNIDLHEGEWGKVGSIIHGKYFHDGKPRVAKAVIEEVDEENNLITFNVIEGDLLDEHKNFKAKLHCVPKDNGSVAHWCFEYEKLHDEIPDSHSLMEFFVDVSKDLDEHLIKGY